MKIDKFNLDDGTYIRFKKIGKGKPILILHTFRNRLEYSDKLGRLLEDKFEDKREATIGLDFSSKQVEYEGKSIKYHFYDVW